MFAEIHTFVTFTSPNSRDAFYGGRIGSIRTYYKAKENEQIKYVDVYS